MVQDSSICSCVMKNVGATRRSSVEIEEEIEFL